MRYSILNSSRKPDITFYSNGRIDITARVAAILQIEAGDVLDIETNGVDYYLYVRRKAGTYIGSHVATAHRTKGCSNNFRAYSKTLASAILNSIQGQPSMARLCAGQPISDNGIKIPIITRLPL
jgi:hypothetical protein